MSENLEPLIEEYKTLLSRHDWTYEFSDDYREWKKGHEELKRLNEMSKIVDPDRIIWNMYYPERFRKGD
jgi:translation initiation factor IF-2